MKFRTVFRLIFLLAGSVLAGKAAADSQVFVWQSPIPRLGGLSGIEISEDGLGLTVLSDQGWVFQGRIARQDGKIIGVTVADAVVLRGLQGDPLRPGQSDSEGIALDGSGGFWVSFEGPARVWHFATADATPTALPDASEFAVMQINAALEAVAVGPDGALYTMAERSGLATRPFHVLRFRDGDWATAFEIPRNTGYLPVGADFGPDEHLYLLERDVLGLIFRSRIRRFTPDGTDAETVFESRFGDFDNLEGISVWQGSDGLKATMVADDNFLFLQQTQLVEIDLGG